MKEKARHVEFLDYVRGIAILSVFLFHSLQETFHYSSLPWNGWLRDFNVSKTFLFLLPASFGWAGVPIFFVVSGFCIHFSFQQQGRKWGGFFIRRFFRIYPPYLMALFLFAIFFSITSLRLFPGHVGWREMVTHFLLIHNFDSQSYYAVNPSFWTIAVEAQLYLLYPVLLMLVSKSGWRRTMVMVAICELLIDSVNGAFATMIGAETAFGTKFPASMLEFSGPVRWLGVSPLAYWFSWSLGAYIADAFLEKKPVPLAKSSVPLWVILIAFSYFFRPLSSFSFLLFALLTATIIGKILSANPPKIHIPRFCLNHLRQTGIWSYSIYLLHQPLVAIWLLSFSFLFPKISDYPLLRYLCCLASWLLIMQLGALWYRFVELPAIALGKQVVKIVD